MWTRPWLEEICNAKHSFWRLGRAGIKFRMSVLLQTTRTHFVFVLNPIKCCVETDSKIIAFRTNKHTLRVPFFYEVWLVVGNLMTPSSLSSRLHLHERISCVYMIRILRPPHWEPVFFASAVCLLADPLQRSGHCALLPRSMHETKQTPWQ